MSTWIFLRGLTRESRHWGDFPETFRHALPDARVYTPDLPGNGIRNKQTSPRNVEQMVECIRSQLAGEGTTPPYHLLAMSLGAMVAVAWATRYPEEISDCVLINTSLRPFSSFHRRLKPGNYLRLLKLALPGVSARNQESAILGMTSHRPDLPANVLKEWTAYRQEYPVSARNAFRQLLAAMRYRAPLVRPTPPILVLTSLQDTLVDSACSRRIAGCWEAALAEHPTAGHDLPLDDGQWVVSQVSLWLQVPSIDHPGQPSSAGMR